MSLIDFFILNKKKHIMYITTIIVLFVWGLFWAGIICACPQQQTGEIMFFVLLPITILMYIICGIVSKFRM